MWVTLYNKVGYSRCTPMYGKGFSLDKKIFKKPNMASLMIEARVTFYLVSILGEHIFHILEPIESNHLDYTTFLIPWKGGGGAFTLSDTKFCTVCPKNWDRRLKFCMQPLILVVYMDHEENLRSGVIDLHFDLHEFRKYGKIPLFSL